MKVPVYFRTRKELDAIRTFIMELNADIRQKIGWSSAAYVHMMTAYTEKSPIYENIPKEKRKYNHQNLKRKNKSPYISILKGHFQILIFQYL